MQKYDSFMSKTHSQYIIAFAAFLFISGWFFSLQSLRGSMNVDAPLKIWASIYQIVALVGGITGLSIAHKWGGYKSVVGRAITFFSIGLLLQVFGQSVNSYYNIFQNQDIPYPSLGDIGFMGSVIMYIIGSLTLMKMSGLKYSWRSTKGKFFTIGIPLAILVGCYFLFLQGYQFDWSNKIKIVLDFGYPLGQALYLSFALTAFFASRNFLGGIMKKPIFYLIFALFFQYLSDFMFLYQANAGTWYAGGMNDYMYFASYFLMALALINIGDVFSAIKDSHA